MRTGTGTRAQVPFFAREFALYVPNLVFFGDSTTTSSERSEVFQAVSVGRLMQKLGVERNYVVGTIYGGFVAYHMAAMWPERVEKVVIASSAVNMRHRDNVEFLEGRAKVMSREELMLPETAAQMRASLAIKIRGHGYMPDFLLNDIVRSMNSKNREKKIELLEGLQIGKNDTVDHISPLRQDVFLVWGEHDQLFLLEKATELKKLLGGEEQIGSDKEHRSFDRKPSPIQQNCVQVIS